MGAENVYKVCDQPHPVKMQSIIRACVSQDIDTASREMADLWRLGFSALDIITTVLKVLKSMDMPEPAKLEALQLVAATHMRIIDGVGTLLQMQGLCAKIALLARDLKLSLPPATLGAPAAGSGRA